MSPPKALRQISRILENLLAPGACLSCGAELANADSLCDYCSSLLRPVPNPCRYCAQPNAVAGAVCAACLLNPPRWQAMIAPLQYQGLARDYLLELKFAEALHLSKTLARKVVAALRQSEPAPEVLLPVPLHRRRLRERGYNQALEISRVWSRALSIPVDRQALTRRRATQSQSGLSAAQREGNVRGAFAYRRDAGYRHVAVVDDVVTTGSTVAEITRELHRGGVEYVEVWAIARAYRR